MGVPLSPELEEKLTNGIIAVRNLRDLAQGMKVQNARTDEGRRAETVERLADVLMHEVLDLRREARNRS